MKVIFANRSDCITKPGGDTRQMLLTKKYLESNYNLDIELCFNPEELSKKECDIVHLFNVTIHEHCAEIIRSALKIKSKIVLTPIYWNYTDSHANNVLSRYFFMRPIPIVARLKKPVMFFINQLSRDSYRSESFNKNIEFVLRSSDLVLPNSNEELECLTSHFSIPLQHKIIPNAVEFQENNIQSSIDTNKNAILQVGLIVPGKNQLNTLLAMKDFPEYPLYFIGPVANQHYYDHLKRIAKRWGNVYFTGQLKPKEVAELYKNALVHVLPSLAETTGLVTLEALYYGCEVVVSNSRFVPVKYYHFDEVGHICNPYDVRTISTAIKDAINNPKQGSFDKNKYFNFFNYQTVAEKTYEAYLSVIKA